MSHNANDIFDPKRYGLITGSKCSVLFPKRSAEVGQRQYAKELANNMYFRFYDDTSTWQTEHGHLSESSAFEYYQTYFDKKAELHPPFVAFQEWGGSADSISEDCGIDFKCPTTLKGWLDYLHEGIDDQQYHQAQMYMMLYHRSVWYICAYLLETSRMADNGMTYPVPYNKRMIRIKVEKEEGWFEKLEAITPKIIEMRDKFYNELKTQFN
jgi:hypothetical protein